MPNSSKDFLLKRVGIVGVGLMGHGIATNIVKAGWTLSFLERPGNQPVDRLVAAGAKSFASAAELAMQSDVIILCVTGSPQVEDALLSDKGVLAGMKPGTIIIDCSTAIPTSTEMLAAKVSDAGGYFLDAPMTRTPKEAAEGRLNLIVGGDRQLYDASLPLLQAFAENIVHAGPVGYGHKLKLLHNFVSLGFSVVVAEAAACAKKADIDPEALVEVLSKGGGGGAILDRLSPFILRENVLGMRFSIANANKDIAYYCEMADALSAQRAAGQAIGATFEEYSKKGFGNAFIPELIKLMGA